MSSNEDTFQGDEQAGVDECLQQLKESGILHEEQRKDGKADNAEDQEDSAIKGRGRGKKKCKKKVFTKDKFWEVVPIYGVRNCLFRAVVSGDDETLFTCSRQESCYAELERRSAHQSRLRTVEMLWLKAVEMLRCSTQLVKSHGDDLGLEYLWNGDEYSSLENRLKAMEKNV